MNGYFLVLGLMKKLNGLIIVSLVSRLILIEKWLIGLGKMICVC